MLMRVAELAVARRTGIEAVAWCRGQHLNPSLDWTRMCQMFTRSAFRDDGGFPTAVSAYFGAPRELRHDGDRRPPYGVAAYFAGPPGSAGHATVVTSGHRLWSNDIKRTGGIDLTTIGAIEDRWGYRYLGWVASVNRTRIYGHVPSLSAAYARHIQSTGFYRWSHAGLIKRELRALPFIPDDAFNLENGKLAGKVDEAVAELQHRLGLKRTGLIGPRVLGHLADRRNRFTACP